jgi:hypothetical protein
MAEHRLKIKIGDHEFEAEGPSDVVQGQFAAFRELVASIGERRESAPKDAAKQNAGGGPLALEKILESEGKIIWPTVRASSVEDAILLILLGQRQLRSNDSVTGAEILDGLRESGQGVTRVDHRLDKLTGDGSVITIGANRGRRYRLSAAGVTKAQEVARDMISLVP